MSFFESAYEGTPPWDIGRPQHEIVRLGMSGRIAGRVLDAGCGTGENALYLAGLGLEVWGVDAAPTAIRRAKEKAHERGLPVNFLVHDALKLDLLETTFDAVVDCGLFHVFPDEARPLFEHSVFSALRPGGKYFLLCFSEREPGDWGPRRVTEAEIRATFAAGAGWNIDEIRRAYFETNFDPGRVHAWLASITRV